jgi:hypothetical protein
MRSRETLPNLWPTEAKTKEVNAQNWHEKHVPQTAFADAAASWEMEAGIFPGRSLVLCRQVMEYSQFYTAEFQLGFITQQLKVCFVLQSISNGSHSRFKNSCNINLKGIDQSNEKTQNSE